MIPKYEEKDGFVLVPKTEFDRMYTALFNVAVTGVIDRDYAPEVYETLNDCVKCARWGLGWSRDL